MRLHTRSVIELHELYHRKEGEKYVVGDPETGEYTFVNPVELRAMNLLQSGLSLVHVKELLKDEDEKTDLLKLVQHLASKRLIFKIDGRVVSPKSEPKYEYRPPARLFGNIAIKFLLVLLLLFALFTLAWRGTIPGPGVFLYQESILLALLAGYVIVWCYSFIRQLAKYGQAQSLGIHSRFGFKPTSQLLLPYVHVPPATEEQHRKIIGTGLLAIIGLVSATAIMSSFFPNGFWSFAFLIGILELLSELFLFADTDLARYLSYHADVHKLNEQTKHSLVQEWNNLWGGAKKNVHEKITNYLFLYLISIVVAIAVVVTYIIPITIELVSTALSRLQPDQVLMADGLLSMILLMTTLFLYAFSTLRHHPLSHNSLFVNGSLLMIVVASFLAATVTASIVRYADPILAIIILFALGVVLASMFERAVRLAHPFSELHTIFESIALPIIAASVPLSILFSVSGGAIVYLMSAMVAVGMLSAIAIHELKFTLRGKTL